MVKISLGGDALKNTAVVSPSLEDYLEAILFLSETDGNARVTDVAANLNISKPSVNRAVSVLKSSGYLDHERYGSLCLTEKGALIARNVAKRHFILTRFLSDFLKIEESAAKAEACLIEHQMSMPTVLKLEAFMDEIARA